MVDLFSTIVDYIVEQNRENNLQIVHLFSWNSPQKDYIIIHSKLFCYILESFFSLSLSLSLSYFLVFSFLRSFCEKRSLIVCYSVRKFIFNFYTISIIFSDNFHNHGKLYANSPNKQGANKLIFIKPPLYPTKLLYHAGSYKIMNINKLHFKKL